MSGRLAPSLRASLILLGLALALPFLVPWHGAPIASFYEEWLAFVLGLVASALLPGAAARGELRVPLVALVPLGICAVLLAQLAAGSVAYREQALVGLLYCLWAFLMAVLGAELARRATLARMAAPLAGFALAGALASSAVALLQLWPGATPLDFLVLARGGGGLFGNLAQANHYASYTAIGLASLACLHALGRVGAGLAAALAAPLLLTLVLSGSRSGWLYLLVLALIGLWLQRAAPGPQARRFALAAALLLPGFLLAHLVALLPWFRIETLPTSGERLFQVAAGVSVRIGLWQEALAMFASAPFGGAGFGQFAWQHVQLSPEIARLAGQGLFHNAHNLPLQLLAELGAVAALVLVAGLATWAARVWRVRSPDPHFAWAVALLAVLGLHSLLEFPLWYAYFLGPAALLAGALEPRLLAVRGGRPAALLTGAMLALGLLTAATLLHAYVRLEGAFLKRQEFLRAPDGAERLIGTLLEIHRGSLLAPYVELGLSRAIRYDGEHIADKLVLNSRVMRFAPAPDVLYRQAILLALAGQRGAALEQLRLAMRAYPELQGAARGVLERLQSENPEAFAPLVELARQNLPEPQSALPDR